MKKIVQISLALLLIGSLMGCGMNKKDEKVVENNETVDETTTEPIVKDDEVTTDQKVELADDVSDKIVGLEEVESANVFVTDNNAYVAVVLKNGTNATEELETKIADEARATNADFKNVYVSTNPDFSKEFTDYGDKIRAGEPVEGFFDEFSDTVKRVFPDSH
ncbi:YhcN/YlaJ family sporulation lipoprotein [Psychrobacillus sp.]|uniref:YhcN/YlaJ family sporulation lipoprotein n=1 Tax=Psychrobacillus sp. TaxID=1871623 RepID=UPI0028BEE5B2|nr:YhcN/YlaJ family sporulation lipoprotein [Psychrobacillus sp.]